MRLINFDGPPAFSLNSPPGLPRATTPQKEKAHGEPAGFQMVATGPAQSHKSPRIARVSAGSGAECGALSGDSDLRLVVESWPGLTAGARLAILAIVERGSVDGLG
jgi:hypothetical protein